MRLVMRSPRQCRLCVPGCRAVVQVVRRFVQDEGIWSIGRGWGWAAGTPPWGEGGEGAGAVTFQGQQQLRVCSAARAGPRVPR